MGADFDIRTIRQRRCFYWLLTTDYCLLLHSTTLTGWPDWRLPGSRTTASPTLTPERISVHVSARRPVVSGFSFAFPFSTVRPCARSGSAWGVLGRRVSTLS